MQMSPQFFYEHLHEKKTENTCNVCFSCLFYSCWEKSNITPCVDIPRVCRNFGWNMLKHSWSTFAWTSHFYLGLVVPLVSPYDRCWSRKCWSYLHSLRGSASTNVACFCCVSLFVAYMPGLSWFNWSPLSWNVLGHFPEDGSTSVEPSLGEIPRYRYCHNSSSGSNYRWYMIFLEMYRNV